MLDWLNTPTKLAPQATPTGQDRDEQAAGLSPHLSELLDALAARLEPDELEELRALAINDPDQTAEACRLILAAPAFPTAEDAAELDRLILRLCELEPHLSGYLPAMQSARLNMAPVRYAGELASFRRWVHQAEAKQAGALACGGVAEPFAPCEANSLANPKATATAGKHPGKVRGSLWRIPSAGNPHREPALVHDLQKSGNAATLQKG